MMTGISTRLLTALLLASLSLAANSQVYKNVDDNGNPAFSDSPAAGAEPIELREPNRIGTPPEGLPEANIAERQAPQSYQQLSISSPVNGEVIGNGMAPFTVSFQVEPTLQKGHRIQLFIDGIEHNSSATTSTEVHGITRGPHSLQAKIVNNRGKPLKQSGNIEIRVNRPFTGK